MKALLVLFILIIRMSGFGQSSYELLLSGPANQYPGTMIEDSQGNIFISALTSQSVIVFKISKLGHIVDSAEFAVSNGGRCNLYALLQNGDSAYYAFGGFEDTTSYFWFLAFDANLDTLIDRKFPAPGTVNLGYMYAIQNSKGNFVIIFPYRISSPPPVYGIFTFEITQEGNFVQSMDFGNPYPSPALPSDIIETENRNYRFYTFVHYAKLGSKCILLDSNFNILPGSAYNLAWQMNDLNTVKKLDDSTLLISGKKTWNNTWKMGIMITDMDNQLLDSNVFGYPGRDEFPGLWNNLDYVTPDSVFYAGTSNIMLSNPYYSPIPTWILLNKLDRNLELQWQKYYGGDACYLLYSVLATRDGGFVMAASRYDHNIQNQEMDVYILKVDAKGELLWTTGEPVEVTDILLYPNPGNRTLYLKTALRDLHFLMLDASGRIVYSREVRNDAEVMHLPGLSDGMYFYQIRNAKGKILKSGKWIRH